MVPFSGDLMASRWAYEALTVNQFMSNAYQKPLFEIEKLESNINYDLQFLIPAIKQETEEILELPGDEAGKELMSDKLLIIRNALSEITLTSPYSRSEQLTPEKFSVTEARDLTDWLDKYRSALLVHRNRLGQEKDVLTDSLKSRAGGLEPYVELKRQHHNEKVAQLVLNRNDLHKIVKKDGFLLRKMDPIYMDPLKRNGRAHFLASEKRLGKWSVPTLHFNLAVIWVMSVILYVLLRYSILQKVLEVSFPRKRKPASNPS